MNPFGTPTIEELLAQASWLRALARRLVDDPQLADDATQETWLKVVASAPPRRGARAWLAAVLTNAIRREHRARARRDRRERAAARAEAVPSTVDLLATLSLQRSVAAAVAELDEPYRTAILLRFFHDRPPREIARALGIPVSTVKSHLTRGLDRLRARLDASHHGDRPAWIAVLAPLAARRGALASVGLGVAVTGTQIKIATAAAVLAVSLLATAPLWRSRTPPPPTSPMMPTAPASHGEGARAGETAAAARDETADDDGRFRIEGLLARDYRLRALAPATLSAAEAGPIVAGDADVVIRFARQALVPIAGLVRTRQGRPVAGAELHSHLAMHEGGSGYRFEGSSATTDASGRFDLGPVDPRAQLRIEGPDLIPVSDFPVATLAAGAMTIEVSVRCRFRVELSDASSADGFTVKDAQGNTVPPMVFRDRSLESLSPVPLVNGRSAIVAVEDRARELILWRGHRELRRVPLALEPGEIVVVRP